VIDFHFAKERDRLAVQVTILTKDEVLYIFVVSNDKFSVEVVAKDYWKYKEARGMLPLIEPLILRAWEEFKGSFPKCPCEELPKRQHEIIRLALRVKARLYEELRGIVDLKEPEMKPASYLLIVEKEGEDEVPLN